MPRIRLRRLRPTIITRADRARDAGEWQRAAGLYGIALERTPNNPPIWVQYGHALKEAGRPAEAENAYRTAIAYEPADADAHLHLGHALKLQGKRADAEAAYGQAWALDRLSAAAARELAAFGWTRPRLAEAADRSVAAPARDDPRAAAAINGRAPRSVPRLRREGLITRADRAQVARQWPLAARLYRKALDRNPDNPPIWVQYGHALKEAGDPAAAEHAYRTALSYAPGVADTNLQLGHALKLRGKIEEAQAAYLRSFARDPSLPHPLLELGELGWSHLELAELRAFAGPKIEPTVAEPIVPARHSCPGGRFRLVYVSGESHTPGHIYRVVRPAATAARAGAEVAWMGPDEIPARVVEIEEADAVIFWRAGWDERVALGIDAARRGATKIVFDVDDLMVDPKIGRAELIDGIRTNNLTEEIVRDHFERMQATMRAADICTATTDELAAHMRQAFMPTMVIPNGFDHAALEISRLAARRRRVQADDELVRIGYAAGSRTHQRDFAQCVDAVARVLRENPRCRLVVFRSEQHILDLDEFASLSGLTDQIEWRTLVPLQHLPNELARFDINLAPLEVGNPFCEAKSELKFFEAALAGVVTIASPTGPFRRAIRHAETGFLAGSTAEWHDSLVRLIADPILRRRIAANARREILWKFGPEGRAEAMAIFVDLLKGDHAAAARAFEIRVSRQQTPRPAAPRIPDHDTVFEADRLGVADVTVIVPLYNYQAFIVEALDSVAAQTLRELDLVLVDDRSTDSSLSVALDWAKVNAGRFNRISVLQNRSNSGLGATRNVGFETAETPFVLPLDADNRLLPGCAAACLQTLQASAAAFAYPLIKTFGAVYELRGVPDYNPVRLANGNYIDAMALIAKSAWAFVGGYDEVRTGWEDFDLWCKFAERGLWGEQVPGGPFAEYRVHGNSMDRTASACPEKVRSKIEHLERRHSWLTIVWPVPDLPPPSSATLATLPATGADGDRLKRLLPILRCPETGGRLALVQDSTLASEDGSRHWPLVSGRPLLFPGMIDPKFNPNSHLSNPLPETALALIYSTPGLVLHLSAGGTAQRFDNVVEVEAALFRHTDLIGDVHRLPFADGVFSAVIALNAFEHYRDPQRAAREIYRVLRPGGRVLIHTAFLQPLHESPWHFYNCTRYGLETWFEKFETEALRVSENFHPGYSVSWLASECEAALRTRLGDAAADAFLATPAQSLVSLWRVDDEQIRRRDPLWNHLRALPQDAQEKLAAGFEYLGRRSYQ
jgi:tetratricopeptide (TPR) repeat protein/SAM-dependent methyltransferase/uncharacterized protein YbaR (Trm112 family)